MRLFRWLLGHHHIWRWIFTVKGNDFNGAMSSYECTFCRARKIVRVEILHL